MKNRQAWQVALLGMLFALAVALAFFENMITPLLGLPPGVKLGLANVVVMYALYFLSRKEALFLVVLKAGFGLLTRGGVAGLLSLAGGVVSLLAMVLLLLPKKKPSLVMVSISGALGHNMGQMIIVLFLFGKASVVYFPILIVSGIGMGVLTASTLKIVLPALSKAGWAKKENKTKKN